MQSQYCMGYKGSRLSPLRLLALSEQENRRHLDDKRVESWLDIKVLFIVAFHEAFLLWYHGKESSVNMYRS